MRYNALVWAMTHALAKNSWSNPIQSYLKKKNRILVLFIDNSWYFILKSKPTSKSKLCKIFL